jgi:citrate lyase beta subunit
VDISDPLVPTRNRRPVSVLYGGANRFSAETPAKLQRLAQRALATWVPDAEALHTRLGLAGDIGLLEGVHRAVAAKLASEPIEDLRIDFEDGLGQLSGNELDALALKCGGALAAVDKAHQPPHVGLRVGTVDDDRRAVALDVVQAFLSQYVEAGGEQRVIITLPKVESRDDVRRFVDGLEALERSIQPAAPCPLEIMVESGRGLMHKGRVIVHRLVKAGRGRVTSVHLGSYDYAASMGIMGQHQQPEHPSVELARQLLLLATRDAGVGLSDGALHQLPLPVHRGEDLNDDQRRDNDRAMREGWTRHVAAVSHAMRTGIFQGWDLHPHQLISRYAAIAHFYREDLPRLTERMADLAESELRATRSGADWEDGASWRGLVTHFVLGHSCGAISNDELEAAGFFRHDDVD